MKLIKIADGFGFVEHAGKEYKVDLSLIEEPAVGDWILAHADLAVSRISSNEAVEILKLIKEAKVE